MSLVLDRAATMSWIFSGGSLPEIDGIVDQVTEPDAYASPLKPCCLLASAARKTSF